MKKIVFCLALLSLIFLGQAGVAEGDERYHPTAAEDIGMSNLLFIEGNWAPTDSTENFTETWIRSKDCFFGIRRDGSDSEKPYFVFAFMYGSKASHRVFMQRIGAGLTATQPEAVEGSWNCPITNRGEISFNDERTPGSKVVSRYDSPDNNTLDIEIETTQQAQTTKRIIHLKRIR